MDKLSSNTIKLIWQLTALVALTTCYLLINHTLNNQSAILEPGHTSLDQLNIQLNIEQQRQAVIDLTIQPAFAVMFFMAAIHFLALFTQNMQDRPTLWLMLFCFSAAVFFLTTSKLTALLIFDTTPWIHEIKIKVGLIAIHCAATSLMMFHAHSHPAYSHPLALTMNISISLLCILLFIVTPLSFITSTQTIAIIYWGLQYCAGLWIIAKVSLDKKVSISPTILAFAALTFAILFDAYSYISLNSTALLSGYYLLFFIFIENQAIGDKLSRALKSADMLSKSIQEEVYLQTHELNKQNQKLEYAQAKLKAANNSLKKLSITDGLTRVYNRMYFDNEFRKEWRRASRKNTQISILMIDVDNFKALNDSAGHLAGDQALQSIAKELHNRFKRAGELVARYGGEEFIVMLPGVGQRKSLAAAEGLRSAIEQLAICYNDRHYCVTISIGVSTTVPSLGLLPDHLLAAADSALYKAKNTGRNRIEITPLLPIIKSHQKIRRK